MTTSTADIARSYGPFPGVDHIHGVSFDGKHVWFAAGDRLHALDPATGELVRAHDLPAHAGTAFDGTHLYQIAEASIHKVDPATGAIVATIPAPGGGADSGMTWAEGSLWVGQCQAQKIHQIDPATGAILRTIESNRFVTGVTWVDGELWHGAFDDDASAELRRLDPATGAVQDRVALPAGTTVTGLESDGGDLLYAAAGRGAVVHAVRRPRRSSPKRPTTPSAT